MAAAHLQAWEPGQAEAIGERCEGIDGIAGRCAFGADATTTRDVNGIRGARVCDDCAAIVDEHEEDGAEPDPDEGEWDV